jgi:hypothetical protein
MPSHVFLCRWAGCGPAKMLCTCDRATGLLSMPRPSPTRMGQACDLAQPRVDGRQLWATSSGPAPQVVSGGLQHRLYPATCCCQQLGGHVTLPKAPHGSHVTLASDGHVRGPPSVPAVLLGGFMCCWLIWGVAAAAGWPRVSCVAVVYNSACLPCLTGCAQRVCGCRHAGCHAGAVLLGACVPWSLELLQQFVLQPGCAVQAQRLVCVV